VLSIGKLGPGQESYYVEAVARGVEDYYAGGEAPGQWIASSTALGLRGEVDADDLHAVLSGLDPSTGTRLGQPHRVPGFDLTFRAPKSVSVLFGLGDPDTARIVRDAHDHAVGAALGWAERHVVWSRRGHGGVELVRGDGLVAAAFRHRTSRNGDPHLHTHVLVPNMVRGEDGKWATLDARRIYTSAKTIGYLYEAQLRHELTVALGVEWGPVRNGIADLAHIPAGVLKAFSTRRAEIEERMAIRNQHSPKAAMVAALDTRRAKQPDPGTVELRQRWADRARELGYHTAQLRDLIGRVQPTPITHAQRNVIEDHLLGADGLTAHDSSLDRRDILQAWCDSLPAGAPIERIEELAEALIDRREIAPLHSLLPSFGAAIRDAAGRRISTLPPQERWTTYELLDIEQHALATSRALLGAERAVCPESGLIAALRVAPTLSDEQIRAVMKMTGSGNGVDVVTAPAGAGKTFAFAAARTAWERAGYRVIGAAHTGVAADELAMAGGIPSTTIARLLMAIDRGDPGPLDGRTVLIIDEAGTAGTRDLARLLAEVHRTGAKVVLSGDAKQLPEIAAGGLFAALIARQPTIELKDNRRQQHEWEVEALRQLRDGDTSKALKAYLNHGRITVGHDGQHTRTLLLGDWWAAVVRGEDAVMLAGRRADVAALNMCGHVRAEAAGMLSGPALEIGGVPIQAGDRVMMLRNDRRLGVRNGNRGEVVDVDPDQRTLRVRLTRGIVDLPAHYVDAGHVGLAYAMTVHKAHGTTCDATMMLADDLLYRELAYGAMSRGRQDNRIYVSRTTIDELDLQLEDAPHVPATTEQDPIDILATGLERRRNKQLALERISAVPLAAWCTGDLVAERMRVRAVLDQAPQDRTADLRALGESRREVAVAIHDQAESVAALKRRRRPWRQRRQPDYDLTRAEVHLGYYERQAERLDREIATIHASQHRRASHLVAHRVDAAELDDLNKALAERLRQQTTRSVLNPPSYILKLLGPRPPDPTTDRGWVRGVVEIERYRLDLGITDGRTAIGIQPSLRDLDALRAWHRARCAIADAREVCTPPHEPVHHPHRRTQGPSLEIGL
jgi:conjugative relaxase-like TrwC/TraI family protein